MSKAKIFLLMLFLLEAIIIHGFEGNASKNLQIKADYSHAQPAGILTTTVNKEKLSNLTNFSSNQNLNFFYFDEKNFFIEDNLHRSRHYVNLYLSLARASFQMISSWSSDISPPHIS